MLTRCLLWTERRWLCTRRWSQFPVYHRNAHSTRALHDTMNNRGVESVERRAGGSGSSLDVPWSVEKRVDAKLSRAKRRCQQRLDRGCVVRLGGTESAWQQASP